MNIKLPLGIALFLVVFSLLLYYFWFYTDRLIYKLLPDESVMVMEVSEADSLFNSVREKSYWSDLQQIDWVSKIETTYNLLDELFLDAQHSENRKVLSALKVMNSKNYDVLLVLEEKYCYATIEKLVKRFTYDHHQITSRTLRDQTIYEMDFPQLSGKLTFAVINGFLTVSLNPELVDESIMDYYSRTNDFWGLTAKPIAGTDIQVYLNFRKFNLLKSMFVKQSKDISLIERVPDLLRWMRLDLQFAEKELNLNGHAFFTKNDAFYSNLLRQKASGARTIPQVLPFNTAVLLHCNVDDPKRFVNKANLPSEGDFKDLVDDWMGKEWAYGFTEPSSEDFSVESFVALHVSDKSAAEKSMKEWADGIDGPPRAPEIYQKTSMYNFDGSIIAENLFGSGMGTLFSDAYYCFIEDYLVMTSRRRHLRLIVDKYNQGETLEAEQDYQTFAAKVDSTSNLVAFIQPAKLKHMILPNASKTFAKKIDEKFDYYQKFSPLAFHFDKDWMRISASGLLGINKQVRNPSTLLWETPLSDEIQLPPQIIVNPETKEKEIIVQDKSNVLYVIAGNGEIRWRKKLDAPILGKVLVVDFHNNGEQQLLFNTAGEVFLMDQDGKGLFGFPIRLSGTAVAGVRIADYDESKKSYSFFVPCGRTGVFGHEFNGRPIEGWRPRGKMSDVIHPVAFFREAGENNYIVTNQKGNIYMLGDHGELLLKVNLGSPVVSEPEIDYRFGKPYIVTMTENGKCWRIKEDGKKEFANFVDPGTYMDYMTENVIGQETTQESVIMSGGKVYVYNEKGKKIASYQFKEGYEPTDVFPVKLFEEEAHRIGVYSELSNEIYLLNRYDELHPDFPIPATSPFTVSDLLSSGENILVAGGERSVFAFKIMN